MQFLQEGTQGWYISLRRCWGDTKLAGPYEKVPLILREIENSEGLFYDLLVDGVVMHLVTDHTSSEYLLTELGEQDIRAVVTVSAAEFRLGVPITPEKTP